MYMFDVYLYSDNNKQKNKHYEKLFSKTKLPNYSRAVNSCLFFNPINI